MNKLILALAVVGLSVGSAYAQASFETADADASGSVTMEEAKAAGLTWTDEEFTAADSDGDGALNAEEFAAATQ